MRQWEPRLRHPAIERELRWLRIHAWVSAIAVALTALALAGVVAVLIWKAAS